MYPHQASDCRAEVEIRQILHIRSRHLINAFTFISQSKNISSSYRKADALNPNLTTNFPPEVEMCVLSRILSAIAELLFDLYTARRPTRKLDLTRKRYYDQVLLVSVIKILV